VRIYVNELEKNKKNKNINTKILSSLIFRANLIANIVNTVNQSTGIILKNIINDERGVIIVTK